MIWVALTLDDQEPLVVTDFHVVDSILVRVLRVVREQVHEAFAVAIEIDGLLTRPDEPLSTDGLHVFGRLRPVNGVDAEREDHCRQNAVASADGGKSASKLSYDHRVLLLEM